MERTYLLNDLDNALMVFDNLMLHIEDYKQVYKDCLQDLKESVDELRETKTVSSDLARYLIEDILNLRAEIMSSQ